MCPIPCSILCFLLTEVRTSVTSSSEMARCFASWMLRQPYLGIRLWSRRFYDLNLCRQLLLPPRNRFSSIEFLEKLVACPEMDRNPSLLNPMNRIASMHSDSYPLQGLGIGGVFRVRLATGGSKSGWKGALCRQPSFSLLFCSFSLLYCSMLPTGVLFRDLGTGPFVNF